MYYFHILTALLTIVIFIARDYCYEPSGERIQTIIHNYLVLLSTQGWMAILFTVIFFMIPFLFQAIMIIQYIELKIKK